jgi:UrcA family protein
MKLPSLKIYAAPVALLIMAGGLAAPTASAETAPYGYQTVSAPFYYDADAPAAQIYAKLHRLANRMCAPKSPSPLALRRVDQDCVAQVVKDGVSRIGRTDIAELHVRANG